MKDKLLKQLVAITLISKLSIFLAIFIGAFFFPFALSVHNANFVYPANDRIGLETVYMTWDSQHYLFLADKGYAPGQISNAFYPLLPWLMKLASFLFLGNTFIAGFVISNIFSLIAVIYFFLLIKRLLDGRTAFMSCILLLAFPTGFYLSLIYTESLFLMLTMIFLYYIYEGKFAPALAAAFLLPLSRPLGVFMCIPLAAFLITKSMKKKKLRFSMEYCLFLGFAAGFAAYLLFMKYATGSYFTGFETLKYFKSAHSFSFLDLPGWFIRNFINNPFQLHGFTNSIIDRLFFVFFLSTLYLSFKKLDSTLFFSALVIGLIPAFSDTFMSYSRYVMVAFPMYTALAVKLKENNYYLIMPMAVLQVVFLIAHSLNLWIG